MARIVFMGTPEFAVPSLQELCVAHEVVAVVTQPDRPAGRRQALRASPIKRLAQASGIPVLQPRRIGDAEAVAALENCDADIFVVTAYGQILPQSVLDLPHVAAVNVHASLLPRWRGAAPIQAAILAGDKFTGATIMMMDAGMDTGPILAQAEVRIDDRETGQTLHDILSLAGAKLLAAALLAYLDGELQPNVQDDALATYAPSIKREQGAIDWSRSAVDIDRQVRAFTPWPGTFTYWGDTRVKLHAGISKAGSAPAGRVVIHDSALAIGTGSGLYVPSAIQLEGKMRQGIDEFVNGHGAFVGSLLES